MFPFPAFPDPAAMLARLFNALLRREPWAGERLAVHAGKTVRFDIGGRSLTFVIQADGQLQAPARASQTAASPAHGGHAAQAGRPSATPAASAAPNVILSIPAQRLADLPAALRKRDPAALAGLMHVQGDAGLAQVVSSLAQDLRWDAEDELARYVGDAAAVQLVRAGKAVFDGARHAADSLTGNVGEYLAHESRMLLSRPVYEEWTAELDALRQRLDQLERRADRLGRVMPIPATGGRS